jgi:hypothetical protein
MTSDEEIDLQGDQEIEEDDDDVIQPPAPPPDSLLEPVRAVPTRSRKRAEDVLHFFITIEDPSAVEDDDKVQRACKLCL